MVGGAGRGGNSNNGGMEPGGPLSLNSSMIKWTCYVFPKIFGLPTTAEDGTVLEKTHIRT